jgi:hypothetical protein
MKIKVTQAGWAGYTGHLGQTEFLDGVSVDDVSSADAAFLAGIVSIEEVGTGRNPSSAQSYLDNKNEEAKLEAPALEAAVVVVPQHAKEELEAIADESGIKGIREIAEPLGIKGNSIVEIIERIMVVESGRALAKD